jgi:hypothetical protein
VINTDSEDESDLDLFAEMEKRLNVEREAFENWQKLGVRL